MGGGVHHDLLGVVDPQEKSRLHSACTQVDGSRRLQRRPAGGPAKPFCALPGCCSSPHELRSCPGLVRAGARTCRDSGGRLRWREVGIRLDEAVCREGEDEGQTGGLLKEISPRSRGAAPNARTDGP